MRHVLHIVGAESLAAVPWWRAPWVITTGKVVWWVMTYLFWLAVAVGGVALAIISAVMFAMGIMARFVGDAR